MYAVDITAFCVTNSPGCATIGNKVVSATAASSRRLPIIGVSGNTGKGTVYADKHSSYDDLLGLDRMKRQPPGRLIAGALQETDTQESHDTGE